MNQLKNHRGRFVSLAVSTPKGKVTVYNAKIQRITDKSVRFYSTNEKRVRTVALSSVILAN